MAEFSKSNISSSRADALGNMINSVKNAVDSPLNQFIDNAQPMKTYWYHIDQEVSYTGKGVNDTAGPYDGGIKYILIKDYICYGYTEERGVDFEKGEHLDARWKLAEMTFLHRPGTLRPLVGDRMSLSIEGHKYLYKVTESVPVNWNNKTFIRTVVTKCEIKNSDYYANDFQRDKLLSRIVEYDPDAAAYGNGPGIGNTGIPGVGKIGGDGDPSLNPANNNGGTKASPFVANGTSQVLNGLQQAKANLMEEFNSYYYIENKNMYMTPDCDHVGFLTYTPLIVDLQMEFRPMWTYGINTILTHETIMSRKSIQKYKKHILRKFLLRKEGAWAQIKEKGIIFSGYEYLQTFYSPMYRVESYLNDGKKYWIYDYYFGDNTLFDDKGNPIINLSLQNVLKVPDRYMTLFENYSNKNLDPEWFLNWLEDYEFELDFADMIFTFLVICIIDSTLFDISKNSIVSI